MDILDRLVRRKTPDKSVVWGVRAPETAKIRWLTLAALMGIPANRLVLFALQDWVRQNGDTLLDSEARNKLADRITESYLKDELN